MIRTKEGVERVSTAVVYVDQPIALDGRLYRGTSEASDPTTSGLDTYEPQSIQEMVSLAGHTIGWKVYL